MAARHLVYGLLGGLAGLAGLVNACNGDSSTQMTDGGNDTTASGPVTVQILALNDFHGNLQPPTGGSGIVVARATDPIVGQLGADGGVTLTDAGTALVPTGGAAYLATYIKNLRAMNPNTVVVSAGDLTGASPLLSNLFLDEPSVLAFNLMGLDYEGVGNHDFDRGVTELTRLAMGGCELGNCDSGARFPGATFKYLAANVDNVLQQTIFPAFDIKTFANGVKVAFIGMTLEDTPGVTVASAVQGLTFQNESQTVAALLPTLKQQMGVAAVVVLLHQGGFQGSTGTYDSCDGFNGDLTGVLGGADSGVDPGPPLSTMVDVLVSAHTHAAYNCPGSVSFTNGILVTSAASYGRLLTQIELTIDPVTNRVTNKTAHNIPVTRNVMPDPDVEALINKYADAAAPLSNRVVGYIAGNLLHTTGSPACETTLGDVIADAQLAATTSNGAVAAFMNPGGIRADLLANPDQSVNYGAAFAVQPFSNLLVTMDVTGAQIMTLLNQQFGPAQSAPKVLPTSSGFTYSYAYSSGTNTAVISNVMLNGQPIDTSTTYRITVNNFLAGGGDGFTVLASGTNEVTGAIDLNALTAYLGANSSMASPLPLPALNRITGNGCP